MAIQAAPTESRSADFEHILWPGNQDWPGMESARETAPGQVELLIHVHRDLSWFAGHFPGHPVLPGVVQLHWAGQYARLVWPQLGGSTTVENLKFQNLVLPGVTLQLSLELNPDVSRVYFKFCDQAIVCSQGRIGFAQEPVHE